MRLSARLVLAGLAVCFIPLNAARGQTTVALDIAVAKNTPIDEQGRDQLRRILSKWNLGQWVFTKAIRIETGVIPHSDPVLTLNTQYLDNDTAQIANFVHEQLHWFFDLRKPATDSAMADLARLYPNAPAGPPNGARDLASTYLHLMVCLSEFNAVRQIFDEATARRTLQGWRHYSWIYIEVLARPGPIQNVLKKYKLDAPDARK